jgi:hypothetical protein
MFFATLRFWALAAVSGDRLFKYTTIARANDQDNYAEKLSVR